MAVSMQNSTSHFSLAAILMCIPECGHFILHLQEKLLEDPTEQTFIASCVERQKLSVAALKNPSSCIKNFCPSVSLDECQCKVRILLGDVIYGCQRDVSKAMISEADRQ